MFFSHKLYSRAPGTIQLFDTVYLYFLPGCRSSVDRTL